jgi:hypothetical protein
MPQGQQMSRADQLPHLAIQCHQPVLSASEAVVMSWLGRRFEYRSAISRIPTWLEDMAKDHSAGRLYTNALKTPF